MPWGRILVAILLTLLIGAGTIGVSAVMNPSIAGKLVRNMQAPGIAAADRTALNAPYDDLVAARYDAIADRMARATDRNNARVQLERMHALLPKEPGVSSRLLRWTATTSTQSGRTLLGIVEHVYPRHVVRVTTQLVRVDNAWRTADFRIHVATKAELAANAFTLQNRPPAVVAFVALTVLIPLFIWATAMRALFVANLRRRALWVVFILLGFMTFRLNGTTGDFSSQLASFQLFGASASWTGSLFDAWIFGVSIPFGAALFWIYCAVMEPFAPSPT